MIISRELSKHGCYCPAAVNVLAQIPATALFYVPYQLRHPESIYRLSLEKICVKFCKVVENYVEKTDTYRLVTNTKTFDIDDLLVGQKDLLHTLQEHLDELWLILKTLVDPVSTTSKALFADKYVVESKLAGAKSFAEAIGPYKSSLRIVNKLKHNQGCLRGVAMWTFSGPYFGYFLEEPDEKGVLGPSPEIHPDQAAYSFSRDLLWHLINVYACSEKLVAAVQRALGAKGISVKAIPSEGLPAWKKVLDLACSLPDAFFPSDLRRGIGFLARDEQQGKITLRFPRRVVPKLPYITHVSCGTRIDAHSLTFKTPLV